MLLAAFLDLLSSWRTVFPQQRTYQRAVQHALGSLACMGRRCLSRIIWTNGGQQRSWSGDYFLYSRCRWDPQQLFVPILGQALSRCPGRLVGMAVDDTRLRKTGRAIPGASYQRDPGSPATGLRRWGGILCRRPSIPTSCWACAFCRRLCCCRCTVAATHPVGLCRCVLRKCRW